MTPSTSLAARVGWLVESPNFRPMYPSGETLPGVDVCSKCANETVVAGSDFCADCRAWMRGDSDDEPPPRSTHYRERISTIIGHMDALGVYMMPEGDQRGVF